MKTLNKIVILTMLAGLFTACDSDDTTPQIVNEEEVITTMTVTLTPVGGGTAIELKAKDADGNGPNAPVITVSGNFATNTTYNGSIELLDELDPSDIEDITEEVKEEDDEHQFFFSATNDIVTFAYSDMDEDANPVGLSFTLTTGNAGSGIITITLIHEPLKSASGVSNGDITNAGGEEDISQTFNIVVQ